MTMACDRKVSRIGPHRLACGVAGTLAALALLVHGASPRAEPSSVNVGWDQPANIRDAAERIGRLQRAQGADAAIRHIDACYRTHGLAETYRAPFEACIVQDYLVTKMLVQIYGRLPPDTHKRTGVPSADELAQAMGRRMVAAFSQYEVSAAQAEALKAEIDLHGLPVFLKIVVPQAAGEIEALAKKKLKQK